MSKRKTVRPGVREISIYGEAYGGKDLRKRSVLSLRVKKRRSDWWWQICVWKTRMWMRLTERVREFIPNAGCRMLKDLSRQGMFHGASSLLIAHWQLSIACPFSTPWNRLHWNSRVRAIIDFKVDFSHWNWTTPIMIETIDYNLGPIFPINQSSVVTVYFVIPPVLKSSLYNTGQASLWLQQARTDTRTV